MRERRRRHDDVHFPMQGKGKRATKRDTLPYFGPRLVPRDRCKVCDVEITSGELCRQHAEGNDPFPAASKLRPF